MPSRQQASNHDPNDSETWRTLAAINGTLLFIRTQSTSSRDRSREVGGWPRASQTSVECQLSPSRLPRGGRTKAARWDPSHARTRESFLSTVDLCFASPREATSSGNCGVSMFSKAARLISPNTAHAVATLQRRKQSRTGSTMYGGWWWWCVCSYVFDE